MAIGVCLSAFTCQLSQTHRAASSDCHALEKSRGLAALMQLFPLPLLQFLLLLKHMVRCCRWKIEWYWADEGPPAAMSTQSSTAQRATLPSEVRTCF